jgi:hypothetical protein
MLESLTPVLPVIAPVVWAGAGVQSNAVGGRESPNECDIDLNSRISVTGIVRSSEKP